MGEGNRGKYVKLIFSWKPKVQHEFPTCNWAQTHNLNKWSKSILLHNISQIEFETCFKLKYVRNGTFFQVLYHFALKKILMPLFTPANSYIE
jgi:hypothetical protein